MKMIFFAMAACIAACVSASAQSVSVVPGQTVPSAPAASAPSVPAGPPLTQMIPDGGITPDELATWLRSAGLTVTADTLTADVAHMSAHYLMTGLSGVKFVILFYECTAERCASLQLLAGWSPCSLTLDQLNQWNVKKRWIKAYYMADQKECSGEMNVAVDGATYKNIAANFTAWNVALVELATMNSTGMLVASAGASRGLPGLVVGRTTYSDIVSVAGRPRSDTQTAEGGRTVRYPFEALRSYVNGSGATVARLVGRDAGTATATLTFDRAGVLLAYSSGRSGAVVSAKGASNDNAKVRPKAGN